MHAMANCGSSSTDVIPAKAGIQAALTPSQASTSLDSRFRGNDGLFCISVRILAAVTALALASCAAPEPVAEAGPIAVSGESLPYPPIPVVLPPSVLSMFVFTGPARPGGKEGYPVRFRLYGQAEAETVPGDDQPAKGDPASE